jgi:hypothetical protein
VQVELGNLCQGHVGKTNSRTGLNGRRGSDEGLMYMGGCIEFMITIE